MRKIASAMAGAAILCALGGAQAEAREVTVKGLGSKPCSEWTKAVQAKKSEAALQETWLAGFITGFNAYGLKESKDVAAGTDLAGLQSAISSYCSAHPTDNLFKAGVAVIGDLQKKSGAK
jgi:hypothetical protein